MFAQTTNAFIKDLTIENAEIVCEGFQEYGVDAGIMIGKSNTTRIMNCNISGNVSKDNETEDIHSHFGLMMGDGYKVTIFESNVSGTITLKNEGDTGGFAGCLQGGSWIEKCFANVKFDLDSIHNAGDPLKAHNCYCSGNIKTVLPEGSKEYQDSYYFAFADNFRDVNCYSNMTTETQYPCKGKLTFFDGTLLYNSDYFSNSLWDDYRNKGVLVGVSTADFKNKDTYKEFDFETKWKWNEEKSCPELIFE